MYMYNGWIYIQLDRELSAADEYNFLSLINKKVSDFNKLYSDESLVIKATNGYHVLMISGVDNRKTVFWDYLIKELCEIFEIAKNSYGLIYARDTLNPESTDAFNVYTIKKGKLELSKTPDPFLSPCSQNIE